MASVALTGRIHERTRPVSKVLPKNPLHPRGRLYMKLSTNAFWIGLPGAMKCQSMALSLHQASIALQVNSVPLSETIEPGLPRQVTIEVSFPCHPPA